MRWAETMEHEDGTPWSPPDPVPDLGTELANMDAEWRAERDLRRWQTVANWWMTLAITQFIATAVAGGALAFARYRGLL